MIFVFGSNLAGRHGKGAARFAMEHHGAKYGQGIGRQGNSYAIPTKNRKLRRLSLGMIKYFVEEFLVYAKENPTLEFEVTKVGCGLAGYTEEQIAPFFEGAPLNCHLPDDWRLMNSD